MGKIRIYIKSPKCVKGCPAPIQVGQARCNTPGHGRYFYYDASPRWAEEHDNGALISCGLTVGEKLNGRSVLSALPDGAVEVTYDQWNHSGCQSACIQRGAAECRW